MQNIREIIDQIISADVFSTKVEPIKFEEAVKYFGDKVPVKPSEYYKISNEWKTKAFTVSGYSSADMLNKFMEELKSALDSGTTAKEFRNNMNEFLTNKGYDGLTPYQADNIFRTNIQTAYNVGHFKRMSNPEVKKLRPYWMYDAVNDGRTRLSHKGMNEKVFPADHPIWDTWFPPNGYRCRCSVRSLSERQVKSMGLTVSTEIPKAAEIEGKLVQLIPDSGFNANPGKKAWEPDISKYPNTLKRAFKERQNRGNA